MGDTKLKTAIYVRVSTDEQAKEGISMDAQIQKCKSYCDARDWEATQIYTDAGQSAGTMNRPAVQQLIKDLDHGKFQNILVYKFDRFSRNLRDLISFLDNIKKKGINFTSVTENIDTTTAMGEAFFQMIGVFAQLERGMVKERVKLAFDKKAEDGGALNRPPFGYRFRQKKMIPHENESEIVKDIFEMRSRGINYKDISDKFSIPISTLYNIIKNPVYVGKIRYKGKLYKGAHKALIKEEIFSKINPSHLGEQKLLIKDNK